MRVSVKSLGIDQLGVDERLELVEEILASLATQGETPSLTLVQTAELDRRLAAYERNPDDVIPLSEVLASVSARGVDPDRRHLAALWASREGRCPLR